MDDIFAGIPDFDDTPEAVSGICPTGRHDFTLSTSEFTKSKSSGNPMIVADFTVDNGENAGHTVREYFVFAVKDGRNRGAERLKSLCATAGFKWVKTPEMKMEDFAAQFVGLRVNMGVSHQYSILDGNSWKDRISEKDFKEFSGDKNEKAGVDNRQGYKPSTAPATMVFAAVAATPETAPAVPAGNLF